MIKNKRNKTIKNSILLLLVNIPILLTPILFFSFGVANNIPTLWVLSLLIVLVYYIFNFFALMDAYKNERSDIQSKMTWTFLQLTLPGISAYCYWLFSRIPKNIKEELKESEILENELLKCDVSNSSIKLLENGEEKFTELFRALERAKNFINIQYFIIKPGILYAKLFSILKNKSEQGVKIRILFDHFGSLLWNEEQISKMRDLGIEIVEFRPIKWSKPSGANNWRSHHKTVIIDNEVSFFGGINFSDEYSGITAKYGDWIDIHYLCKGEIISSLNSIFFIQWFIATKEKISNEYSQYKLPDKIKATNTKIMILNDSPDRSIPITFETIKKQIDMSVSNIRIITPYVSFPISFKDKIRDAINRGVDIEIITIGKADKISAYYQSTFDTDTLTDIGVKVYRAENLFVHSKMFLFDNDNVILGTSNLDFRAFFLHFEVNFHLKNNENDTYLTYFENLKKFCNLQTNRRRDWWIGRSLMYFVVRFFKGFF